MSIKRILTIAPLAFLFGCPVSVGSIDEDNYAAKAAEATCKQMKACNPIQFYVDPDDVGVEGDAADLYPQGSMSDCIDEHTSYFEDLQDDLEDADCELDGDKASECFNSGSCKSQAENYSDFYDEDGEGSCQEMWEC